jgi:hypothetical protein
VSSFPIASPGYDNERYGRVSYPQRSNECWLGNDRAAVRIIARQRKCNTERPPRYLRLLRAVLSIGSVDQAIPGG